MDKFIEKWRSDNKYRAKIKLLLYALFIIFATIYAISLNNNYNITNTTKEPSNEKSELNDKVITIPENYNYQITINIDDDKYEYSGKKLSSEETITKTIEDKTTNYILKDNEYYIEDNSLYIKTTKEEVYDVVNYNYLNLETINNYLSKSIKDNNQYLVYLKDIILGNDSNEYFVILINENNINIDYTPLMKEFNHDLKKYEVKIQIKEIE